MLLKHAAFEHYVDAFNRHDRERVKNHVANHACWDWMQENIPLFECPDSDIEQVYYFRWWTYRKHIRNTPDGFVVTEFLPDVRHTGKYNTSALSAGLHIREGRWLHDARYLQEYALFWFRKWGAPRKYNTWLAAAVEQFCHVTGNLAFAQELLPDLVRNHEAKEQSHRHASGLLWCRDTPEDGGEFSISGHGLRPTLNSYMYGDASAIARMAEAAGQDDVAGRFAERAAQLKERVQQHLWDPEAEFFKTFPLARQEDAVNDWDFRSVAGRHNVRELYGYIPWMFELPDPGYEAAWKQLLDPAGFLAPYGPTTAEQRHPRFMRYRVKRCQWDGASWPFTTSMALMALANLLTAYEQDVVTPCDYLDTLRTYARSQHRTLPYGDVIPWIGEDLHPQSGIWLARAIIFEGWGKAVRDLNQGLDRGKDYNHSCYCDLVIGGLVGLKPRTDERVEVMPLVPADIWDWFCLDNVRYHGRTLTICYDRTGQRYNRGKGLRIFADGKELAHAKTLGRLSGMLP